jgi:hypothetical protein
MCGWDFISSVKMVFPWHRDLIPLVIASLHQGTLPIRGSRKTARVKWFVLVLGGESDDFRLWLSFSATGGYGTPCCIDYGLDLGQQVGPCL